jgi:hypothetical protein
MKVLWSFVWIGLLALVGDQAATSAVLFADNFEGGASDEWLFVDQRGTWKVLNEGGNDILTQSKGLDDSYHYAAVGDVANVPIWMLLKARADTKDAKPGGIYMAMLAHDAERFKNEHCFGNLWCGIVYGAKRLDQACVAWRSNPIPFPDFQERQWYFMKGSVLKTGKGTAIYSFKMWHVDKAEPGDWDIEFEFGPENDIFKNRSIAIGGYNIPVSYDFVVVADSEDSLNPDKAFAVEPVGKLATRWATIKAENSLYR